MRMVAAVLIVSSLFVVDRYAFHGRHTNDIVRTVAQTSRAIYDFALKFT